MHKVLVLLLIFSTGVFSVSGQAARINPFDLQKNSGYKALDERYREWLNMISPIASSREVNAFLQLVTDSDRDMFINLFWRQRDPTPGTEANEYRDEIENRFRYVNRVLGRGTSRPGWMTDMGRTTMVLGRPNSIESFENQIDLHPVQVWYYYGDQELGMPLYFNITFYKPHGSGEWKMYNPSDEGPLTLLVNSENYDSRNHRQVYEALKKKAPTLIGPAYSMIPGQGPADIMPSPKSNLVIASIFGSPLKKIKDAYAANFIKYKGLVRVDYSTNYIDAKHRVSLLKDDLRGYNLLTFSLKPEKISLVFDQERNHYTFSFDLSVSMRQGELEVFSFKRDYEYSVLPGQLERFKAGGIVIHDSFPLVPGEYKMIVFMQNKVSKDFSFFEEEIAVPLAANPMLAAPMIGFSLKELGHNFFCPYKIGLKRLAVDPENIIAAGEKPVLWLGAYNIGEQVRGGALEWEILGQSREDPFRKSFRRPLAELPAHRNLNFIETLPELPPDYYVVTGRLIAADGKVVDLRQTEFSVSVLNDIARPSELYNQLNVDGSFFFDYQLGIQLRNLDEIDRAAMSFAKSLREKPDFFQARQELLAIRLQRGEFNAVLEDVELLPTEGEEAFKYHLLRGQALYGLRRFNEALDEFLAANRIINTDYALINMIARSYLACGEPGQAVKALRTSLLLNNEQEEVRQLLASLEEKTPDN